MEVVVVLENEDYCEILHSDSPLDKYLIENIGGSNRVSAILGFYSVGGTSSSALAMETFKMMKPIIVEKNWQPIERVPKSEIPRRQTYIGNKYWTGQYYANICGGSTTQIVQTHCKVNGKMPVKFQLFNSAEGYMDETVGHHVKSTMLYMLLFTTGITEATELDMDSLSSFKKDYESHLSHIHYDSGCVLDWCKKFIMDDQLICPLDISPILFTHFLIRDSDHNYMQLCHNEAASSKKYFQDRTTKKFMSDYRPNNIFWGTHQGNMEQQDMTIKEYHCHIRAKLERLNSAFPIR